MFMSSCKDGVTLKNHTDYNEKSLNFIFNEDGFIVQDLTGINNNLNIIIGDKSLITRYNKIIINRNVQNDQEIKYIDLLKENKDKINDIALCLANNSGKIFFKLRMNGCLDTTIIYNLRPNKVLSDKYVFVKNERIARLKHKYDVPEENILRWLYQNKYKVNDSIFNIVKNNIKILNQMDFLEYITGDDVPVVSSLKNINYNIESDLVADYYYLFACTNDSQIKNFVEDMVSLKFEGCEKNLGNPIKSYRDSLTNGLACIMLIGIHKDWSYETLPIGLVYIDNIKPTVGKNYQSEKNRINKLDFREHNISVEYVGSTPLPEITGNVEISWGDFEGNYMFNIPFTFNYTGDISTVKVGNTEIEINKYLSPHHENVNLYLQTGDNYIPVEISDLRGNKTLYTINIRTKRIKNNAVIENNIYI